MSSLPPAIDRFCSTPPADCVTASIQSVLALPSRETFSGANCCTAVRNCAAFSIDGFFTIVEVEKLLEYETLEVPATPDLVVIKITPLAPRDP